MYTPSAFDEQRPELLHQLVAAHPLGLLIHHDAHGALDSTPLPFVLHDRGPGHPVQLQAHVARANPVWREAAAQQEVLVVFQGPQAYISPSWYPSKAEHGKVVPTWNYIVVQAWGRLTVRDDAAWLRQQIESLTHAHEQHRPHPWQLDDAPADYLAAMVRGIVGLEIDVQRWHGKWKMSQNQPPQNQRGVIAGLRAQGGDERRAVADAIDAAASGAVTRTATAAGPGETLPSMPPSTSPPAPSDV